MTNKKIYRSNKMSEDKLCGLDRKDYLDEGLEPLSAKSFITPDRALC